MTKPQLKSPRDALEIARRYSGQPPVDVFSLAKELGLGPVPEALPPNISGKIRREPDGAWTIVYNRVHALVRQRFTVAHEIGHFIFHRELLAGGVSDTLAYRADDQECPNPAIGREQEWQANNFASNLLVPDVYLKAARAAGFNTVDELAPRFAVSTAVMRIKLRIPLDEVA